jgi:hypothetical protein
MKTRALFLSALAVLLGSCRENRASVQVQQVCYPTVDCTFSAKCDQTLIGHAVMDVTANHDMTLFFQVANELTDNTALDQGRVNTNNAHVTSIETSYGEIGLGRDVYNTPNFGVPAGGTTVVRVDVVRGWIGQNAALLDAAVTAGGGYASMVGKVKMRGYFDDGSSFETGEFPVGVDVCAGCIAQPQCAAGMASCPFVGMEPASCVTTG